jgi:hypothetical protein
MVNSENRTMAAQARLFYPVRCAAISLGPPSPAYPKPLPCPNSLCRQSVIMQNEPNFKKTKMDLNICSERRYEKNHPSRLCENEPKTNPIFELGPQPEQLRLMSCVYGLASAEALAYNSAKFESTNACLELFREQFETIRDNWR